MICGCHFKAGQAIPPSMIIAHKLHTREVLGFWQVMIGPHQDFTSQEILAHKTREYLDFIDRLFPTGQVLRLRDDDPGPER